MNENYIFLNPPELVVRPTSTSNKLLNFLKTFVGIQIGEEEGVTQMLHLFHRKGVDEPMLSFNLRGVYTGDNSWDVTEDYLDSGEPILSRVYFFESKGDYIFHFVGVDGDTAKIECC